MSSKQEILEVAAKCIARLGIEKTTTRAIAEMAGVSRGLVPYYIPNRSDLLYEVISYAYEAVKKKARTYTEDKNDLEKLLIALRANFEGFLLEPHYYTCFLLSYSYCSFDFKIKQLHTRIYRSNRERVCELLRNHTKHLKLKKKESDIVAKADEILEMLDGGLMFYTVVEQTCTSGDFVEQRMTMFSKSLDIFLSNE